jgi:hypothetical protein
MTVQKAPWLARTALTSHRPQHPVGAGADMQQSTPIRWSVTDHAFGVFQVLST